VSDRSFESRDGEGLTSVSPFFIAAAWARA